MPSIDVAAKIADALGVTPDYLIKDGEYDHVDEETLKRLREIQKVSPENTSHVYALLDAFILFSFYHPQHGFQATGLPGKAMPLKCLVVLWIDIL